MTDEQITKLAMGFGFISWEGDEIVRFARKVLEQSGTNWPTVRAALQSEIDHCASNNVRLTPEFGRVEGRPGVPSAYIEAVIQRFDALEDTPAVRNS